VPRASVPPRSLGSAWARHQRPGRTATTLSRAQIVTAALALVDREGLSNLSMRKLAADLGVGVTTLYWHVADKEEMLDLICDEVIGEIDLTPPPAGGWVETLVAIFEGLRQALLRHQDLATLLPTRNNVGPHALAAREAVAAALVEAGLPHRLLAPTDHALFAYVTGAAAGEVAVRSAALASGSDPEQLWDEEARYLSRLAKTAHPALHALAQGKEEYDEDDTFEYGLRLLLDGIAAHVRPAKPPRKRAGTAKRGGRP